MKLVIIALFSVALTIISAIIPINSRLQHGIVELRIASNTSTQSVPIYGIRGTGINGRAYFGFRYYDSRDPFAHQVLELNEAYLRHLDQSIALVFGWTYFEMGFPFRYASGAWSSDSTSLNYIFISNDSCFVDHINGDSKHLQSDRGTTGRGTYRIPYGFPIDIDFLPLGLNIAIYALCFYMILEFASITRRTIRSYCSLCRNCGYDLKGVVGSICPECGNVGAVLSSTSGSTAITTDGIDHASDPCPCHLYEDQSEVKR